VITEHDLQEAIAECEGQRNPSTSTCLKLAAFYTIRDKLFPAEETEDPVRLPQYSYARSIRSMNAETEFKQIAAEIDPEDLVDIMDELMTTLKAMIPKLYDGVMRKMSETIE